MYGVFEYSNSPSRRLRPEEVHEVISTIADHNPTTAVPIIRIPTYPLHYCKIEIITDHDN